MLAQAMSSTSAVTPSRICSGTLASFGTLLWLFHAGPELFRTGWFVESVASQVLVIFAIRSARPMLAGKPHPALALLVQSAS